MISGRPILQGRARRTRKTHEAIERAQGKRGLPRSEAVCRQGDRDTGPAAAEKKMGRPRVPFKWNKRRLQVDVERLDALDASQKAELRKVIEQILARLWPVSQASCGAFIRPYPPIRQRCPIASPI